MRKCPECGKTYDDTWKICVADESILVNFDGKETVELKVTKKRPVGIVVIAILLILGGLMGMFSLIGLMMPAPSPSQLSAENFKAQALKLNPRMTEKEKADLEKFINSPQFSDMAKAQEEYVKSGKHKIQGISYVISGFLSLVAGIALLRLKEWGRRLTIAVQLLDIAVFILSILLTSRLFTTVTEHMPAGPRNFFPIAMIIPGIFGAIIITVIISYLCRSQVKEWFV